MAKREDYTLVLGGGGARGSYEIGAWKALRENKIAFQAAAGTSVGALNAALVAQGDYDLGEEIWSKIKLSNVVDIPESLVKDGKISIDLQTIKDQKLLSTVFQKGLLLDPKPLKKLLDKYINEDLIRKKNFDLGLVTFNLTDFKPTQIFLDEMEKGLLQNYLLASANMPVFKNTEIGGKKFLDGGVYDNVPFNMMKRRGYRRFVVVDISGLGNTKRPDIVGTETIYIKNSIDLEGLLDFNAKTLEKYRLLGYLDTQKVFGGNSGQKYFYTGENKLSRQIEAVLADPEIARLAEEYGGKAAGRDIRNLLPPEYREVRNPGTAFAECAAAALRLERAALYKFDDFVAEIRNGRRQIEKKAPAPALEKSHFQNFFQSLGRKIEEINPQKDFSAFSPQEYVKAAEILTGTTKMNLEKKTLFKWFPELPAAQVFFSVLERLA